MIGTFDHGFFVGHELQLVCRAKFEELPVQESALHFVLARRLLNEPLAQRRALIRLGARDHSLTEQVGNLGGVALVLVLCREQTGRPRAGIVTENRSDAFPNESALAVRALAPMDHDKLLASLAGRAVAEPAQHEAD